MLEIGMFFVGLSMGAVLREGIKLIMGGRQRDGHRAGGRWARRHPVTAWIDGEEESEDALWLESRL